MVILVCSENSLDRLELFIQWEQFAFIMNENDNDNNAKNSETLPNTAMCIAWRLNGIHYVGVRICMSFLFRI